MYSNMKKEKRKTKMKKEGKKCNRNLRNKMRANYYKAVGCVCC